MTPTQQIALEALAGRALAATEIAAADARDDATLAASLSVGRTQTVPTPIGFGQIMSALGPVAGAAVLDALDVAKAGNRPLYWAWTLLNQGKLDVGNPVVQASIRTLAAAGLMTTAQAATLIALSSQPDPVSVGVVSEILNSEA